MYSQQYTSHPRVSKFLLIHEERVKSHAAANSNNSVKYLTILNPPFYQNYRPSEEIAPAKASRYTVFYCA